jgi:hypothetical protein
LPVVNGSKHSPSCNIGTKEYEIGTWYRIQNARLKNGYISDKQIALLKEINPSFGERVRSKRKSWEETFEDYRIFVKENGREPVQKADGKDENRMAVWASRNKQIFHKTLKGPGKLSDQQMKMLKDINFDFQLGVDAFSRKRKLLIHERPEIAKQFHPTKNGNLSVDTLPLWGGYKVWWMCELGHSYQSYISSRSRSKQPLKSCPICYTSSGKARSERAIAKARQS